MQAIYTFISAAVGLALSGSQTVATHDCRVPSLVEQKQDEATLRRLEHAWQSSYVTGDVEARKCLLDRGFLEILDDGKIKRFEDEISSTQSSNNAASSLDQRIPHIKILIHGNAAVAYGRINTNFSGAESVGIPFADYFVWEQDAWHVYFSRQTKQAPKKNW